VLDGSILPSGAAVGDELKVEAEQGIDSMDILSVVKGRAKSGPDLLELLPIEENFQAVIETRAQRDRSDRGGRKGRDGKGRGRDGGRDGKGRGRDGGRDGEGRGGDGRRGPRRPHFDPPPEVPQRPKPKRLRPGKARRNEVLAELPEEQRAIAELAIQGMPAVRSRLAEDNKKLEAEGKPTMPQDSVLKMAEEMLPKLRVADWLDRAEAAQRQMDNLDLRDLRSVVAASDDSMVARDESTRAVAEQLKADLVKKQEQELKLWLEDVDAALTVGRSIRALRLSSQPPKAGVMFPPELARKLGAAATAGLTVDDSSDRWAAVMEAAAFSPVRTLVTPTAPPSTITDDLRKTALRLGPLLPQIAALLGVEVPEGAPRPKPLRPGPRKDAKKKRPAGQGDGRQGQGDGRRNDGRRDSGGRGSDEPKPDAKTETPKDAAPAVDPDAPKDATPATDSASAPEASATETATPEAPATQSATPETTTPETPTPEATAPEATAPDAPAADAPAGEPAADDTPG